MKKSILLILISMLILTGCNLQIGPAQSEPTLPPVIEEATVETQELIEEVINTPTPIEVLPPTSTPEPIEPTATEELVEEEAAVEDPTSTPEPEPTATLAATDVPATGDPAMDNGKSTWSDALDTGSKVFIQDEDWYSIGKLANGKLVFSGKQNQIPAWRMAGTGGGPFDNTYLEAVFETTTCNVGSDSYGLIYRVPDIKNPNQGFMFGLTCDGQWYLKRWDGKVAPEGKMYTLISGNNSTEINTGSNAINRVGVMVKKSRMVFYINGVSVGEYTSEIFPKGFFGVFVRPGMDRYFTVNIDKVAYWDNPKEPAGGLPSPTEEVTKAETYDFDHFLTDFSADPGIDLGVPTWKDYLNGAGNWGSGMSSFNITTSNENGELVMIGLKKEASWVLASTPKLDEGVMELVIKNDNCQVWDSYGIFFRSPSIQEGDRGYLFGATCNGYYYLWMWDGKSAKMTKLIDYTRAIDVINYGAGAKNRFDVLTKDNTIQLYINGVYLNQYTDSTFTEGYFGVFLRPQYTEQLTIRLDEASYWVNDTAE
ncbi:MAG: hypothetical protein JW750_09495 [Anaerolineaceae bacterium]|nr:hypothetical protein [Anaerolineaceae bacterium]